MLRFAKDKGYRDHLDARDPCPCRPPVGAPYIKAKTGAKVAIGEHIRDVQRIFRPVFDATI